MSIDVTAAQAHPKVKAVITGADLAAQGLAWMPTLSNDVQAVLATDKVRFQGQEVAFVVAEDRYSARDALELIDVEYDILKPVVDVRQALAPDAPVIRDDLDGKTDNHCFDWETGDKDATEAVFASADVVVTEDIVYPRVHPAPMETCGCVADYERVGGQLTLWTTSQAPHAHRTVYALVSGLPEHKIRVIAPDIGGGFGNKVPIYPGYVCAIVASLVIGKPVKWMEDRSENLVSTGFARDYVMRGEIAATKEGKILAIRTHVIADHGAFNGTAAPIKYPAGFFGVFTGSYDIEAAYCSMTAVYTNKAPGGVAYACSFRITEAVYLVERIVDCLAYDLEMDPVALRRKNLIRPEQFPYTSKTGWVYDSGEYERALDLALEMAGYDDAAARAGREARAGRADGHRGRVLHRGRRGRAPQGHGHPRAGDGRRRRAAGAPDREGRGPAVLHEPGPGARDDVRPDRRRGDRHPARRHPGGQRRHRPDAVRPGHLRQPVDAGLRCGRRARRAQGARQGADHRVGHARGVGRRPRVAEGRLPREGRPGPVGDHPGHRDARPRRGRPPDGIEGGLEAQICYNPSNLTYPFGAYICVVDIDPGTAAVKVRRFIAVDDCGTRINPMIIEGQVHGGLTDGVGMALMEMIAFDEDGNCLGGSLMDYLIPTALEVPHWETGHTVTPSPHHPIGAKGVGESATVGSPPAVVNAVVDALKPFGIRHADMPLTPSRVWDAMQGRPNPADLRAPCARDHGDVDPRRRADPQRRAVRAARRWCAPRSRPRRDPGTGRSSWPTGRSRGSSAATARPARCAARPSTPWARARASCCGCSRTVTTSSPSRRAPASWSTRACPVGRWRSTWSRCCPSRCCTWSVPRRSPRPWPSSPRCSASSSSAADDPARPATAVLVSTHGATRPARSAAPWTPGSASSASCAAAPAGAALLAELALTPAEAARVHLHVGLDIGARTAPEIGVVDPRARSSGASGSTAWRRLPAAPAPSRSRPSTRCAG